MSTASNAAGYQPSKKSQTGGQLSWLERLTPRKAPSRYSRTVAASSPPHALTFDDPIPGDGRGSSRHWQRHDSSTAIQDRDLRDCTRLKTAKSWNDPTWVGTVTYAQDTEPTKSILACYLCLPDKASQPASQPARLARWTGRRLARLTQSRRQGSSASAGWARQGSAWRRLDSSRSPLHLQTAINQIRSASPPVPSKLSNSPLHSASPCRSLLPCVYFVCTVK